ncbi:methyltransferase [Bdellovibrionota bacterium FG-2]
MKNDPWYKTSLSYGSLGQARLRLDVPHDVFSTLRVDEGTLLLLEHLPKNQPHKILDMGCGYGALGLPIAAKFPGAQIEMVDRDLLAVAWSAKNAEQNQLSNVVAYGSLGYRDLKTQGRYYDWILCNVPARIGRPFIKSLLEQGRERLTLSGELRVVVIRDLAPLMVELGEELHWPVIEVARGPRHVIFSLTASSASADDASARGGGPMKCICGILLKSVVKQAVFALSDLLI